MESLIKHYIHVLFETILKIFTIKKIALKCVRAIRVILPLQFRGGFILKEGGGKSSLFCFRITHTHTRTRISTLPAAGRFARRRTWWRLAAALPTAPGQHEQHHLGQVSTQPTRAAESGDCLFLRERDNKRKDRLPADAANATL